MKNGRPAPELIQRRRRIRYYERCGLTRFLYENGFYVRYVARLGLFMILPVPIHWKIRK
jgi:hypothetical protein